MVKFFITIEERRQAQANAAALDIGKTKPPGQYPYVWDNRLNAVNRWYDYASPESKIGTIYFEPIHSPYGQAPRHVRCTTEITQRRGLDPERRVKISDQEEHEKLVGYFLQDLLGRESDVVAQRNEKKE